MEVLAFFVCVKVVPRTTDEMYDIIGFPRVNVLIRKIPCDEPLTMFLHAVSDVDPVFPLTVYIDHPSGKKEKLFDVPIEKNKRLWVVNGPLCEPVHLREIGKMTLILMHGLDTVGKCICVVDYAS